jgi:hypothetical protein
VSPSRQRRPKTSQPRVLEKTDTAPKPACIGVGAKRCGGSPCTRILEHPSVDVGSRLRPVFITQIKPPRRLIALTDDRPDDDVILT